MTIPLIGRYSLLGDKERRRKSRIRLKGSLPNLLVVRWRGPEIRHNGLYTDLNCNNDSKYPMSTRVLWNWRRARNFWLSRVKCYTKRLGVLCLVADLPAEFSRYKWLVSAIGSGSRGSGEEIGSVGEGRGVEERTLVVIGLGIKT